MDEKTETVTFDADRRTPKYGLKDLWIEFSQSTGLHAVDKIKLPSMSPFSIRGLLWILAMCSTSAFLVYNLVGEIGNYYDYPTVTKVTPKIQNSIEFPAVTICNRCTLNKSRLDVYPDMMNYFFNSSMLRMKIISFSAPTSDVFQEPLSLEWWKNMSMEGSKMLSQCVFQGDIFDCMTKFRPVFTKEGLCHTFNFNLSEMVKVWTAGEDANLVLSFNINQNDYTFRKNMAAGIKVITSSLRQEVLTHKLVPVLDLPLNIGANFRMDFRSQCNSVKWAVRKSCVYMQVLLHDPRVHPDASSTVVMAAPGFSTFVAMQKFVYMYQPHPYTAFDDMKCVDTTSSKFVNPLKYYSHYTYNHCFMECVQMKAFSECGCVGPSDPQDGPRCSLAKLDSCYKPFVRSMSQDGTLVRECGCVSECTFDRYPAQVSSSSFPANIWDNTFLNITRARDKGSMKENFLELRVFYDQMTVTSITQQAQYTVASLFSNVGGQMGLCLGASILTVMEITELLVFIILFLCDKCRGRKARNRINTW
ncbi:acid-sensing ion channel 1A-like [Haliotis rufescens]|uniref:acid-sensing ion channel 1A-like n=1 Tax=Haliotis rufescens TaxID=6454 RepID=UPI00201F9AC0|nr:acid-sensing ion channel 1A-like [Haliotis rufescens]